MRVVIGGVDVTSAVQESTYKIDSVAKYEEWKDAGNKRHRGNIHYKVEGTFDMVFLPVYSMEFSTFLSLLNANTADGVTTLSLSVNNLDGQVRIIRCFVTIESMPMRYTKNGSDIVVKRCTVTIEEC